MLYKGDVRERRRLRLSTGFEEHGDIASGVSPRRFGFLHSQIPPSDCGAMLAGLFCSAI